MGARGLVGAVGQAHQAQVETQALIAHPVSQISQDAALHQFALGGLGPPLAIAAMLGQAPQFAQIHPRLPIMQATGQLAVCLLCLGFGGIASCLI